MESIQTTHFQNQPTTHVSLHITFPFTITVASPANQIPITFTVNPTTISVAPIPRHHPQYGLAPYANIPRSFTLLLPVSNLTLPAIINIATDTMFIKITVTATRTVYFTPMVNTNGIPVRERSPPFEIFDLTGLTDTASITIPFMISFNIKFDTNTTIIINVIVWEDAMVITSETVTRVEEFLAIITMGIPKP